MRIPTWRLALTGAAIVVLTVVGVGFVAASSNGSAPQAASVAAPAASAGSSTAAGPLANHPLLRRLLERLENRPGLRRLVDGRLTFTDQNGQLVTIQIDHGTIASIGAAQLTIAEAGGGQVTVSTDANTVVRLGDGSGKGSLADLKAGDEVFVQSRVDGSTVLAKHILRVPVASTMSPLESPAPSA
jgi:hypothetical protein